MMAVGLGTWEVILLMLMDDDEGGHAYLSTAVIVYYPITQTSHCRHLYAQVTPHDSVTV